MKKTVFSWLVFLAFGAFSLTGDVATADLSLSGPLSGVYTTETGDITTQGDCVVDSGASATLVADRFFFGPGFHVRAGGRLVNQYADHDGLPDAWEMQYFGNLNQGQNDDPDGDGLTNLVEYQLGTNPAVYNTDSDGDDLPDTWEVQHFGNLNQGSADDPDGDGLTNLTEYQQGASPTACDSDDENDGRTEDELMGGEGLLGGMVCILSGNGYEARRDLRFQSPNSLGLSFDATYNSRLGRARSLGYGWSHTYEMTLDPSFEREGTTLLKIVEGSGHVSLFQEDTPSDFKGVLGTRSGVQGTIDGYVWSRPDGSRCGFSSSGVLMWMDDEKGNRLELTYDVQGRLEKVTDLASGREITFHFDGNGLLHSISGPVTEAVPDGTWVTFTHDLQQNLTGVAYADGSESVYGYADPHDIHNLTSKRDAQGHLLKTWSYDGADRAVGSFSADGKSIGSVAYVSQTRVDVTDSYGVLRTYTVEENAGMKRIAAVQGMGVTPYSESKAVRWVYDAQLRLTEVEFAGGTINRYQNHDDRGNPQTVILASGSPQERIISYAYHPRMRAILSRSEPSVLASGNKVTVLDFDDPLDPNDSPALFNENPTNLPHRIVESGYTRNASGNVIAYENTTALTYNGKGQLVSADGPLAGSGDVVQYAYEPATGNLDSITLPLIEATVFSAYDGAGNVGHTIDPNGQEKSFYYDARGRLKRIVNHADGSQSQVVFNLSGLVASTIDGDGVTQTLAYDPTYGRLSQRMDHQGNTIDYLYDTRGNLVEKDYHDGSGTLSGKNRWSYQHPEIPGLLWREIQGDDTYTAYEYDNSGNVAGVTDPNGNRTAYAYDSLNRPVSETRPGNFITTYAYDSQGNLVSVTDAEGHETGYVYDDLGRTVETSSSDAGVTSYSYDAAGNLLSKTDARGIVTQYAHDVLKRLTTVNFPAYGGLNPYSVLYTYDQGANGKGHLTSMSDLSGGTSFTYDSRGRLRGKTATIGGIAYPVSRDLTPGGRIARITTPSGRTVDFERSQCACRVSKVTTTKAGVTKTLVDQLSYRPFGGASGMQMGSGGSVNTLFDLNGRLIVANPGASKTMSFTYDNNGHLTGVSGPNTPQFNRVFTYDDLNRLTEAQGPFGTINYSYDGVGNRLNETLRGQSSVYSYNPGTNLVSQITGSLSASYGYDGNGNATEIANRDLTFNQENRLIRVDEGGSALGEYTYNALGQRAIKQAGGVTTFYVYDFEGDLLAESDGTGALASEYLYQGSRPLAKADVASGAVYYYHNDGLGTPQLMTDTTNTAVWQGVYKPFGEAEVSPTSTVVNNFRLPGQYYDAETGYHYNYHRYYDPKTGRYLTPDPIGLAGGINPYVYVQNDPVNFFDPDGLARTPAQGEPPNSQQSFPDGKGGRTDRYYGPDGRATKDIDYGHDHVGAGDPHEHPWDWNKSPPRQPEQPISPDPKPDIPPVPVPFPMFRLPGPLPVIFDPCVIDPCGFPGLCPGKCKPCS